MIRNLALFCLLLAGITSGACDSPPNDPPTTSDTTEAGGNQQNGRNVDVHEERRESRSILKRLRPSSFLQAMYTLPLLTEHSFPHNGLTYPPPRDGAGACVKMHTAAEGTVIKTMAVKSVPRCQMECERSKDCKFFHYWFDQCQLLSSKTKTTVSRNHFTGSKRCFQPFNCYIQGYKTEKEPLRVVENIANMRDCRTQCLKLYTCLYFEFTAADKKCKLLGTDSLRSIKRQNDVILGGRECREGWCYLSGHYYTAGEIKRMPNWNSGVQCEQECFKNDKCQYFSYGGVKNECVLFDATGVFNKSPFDPKWISGMKECGTPKTCFENKDHNRKGNLDIDNVNNVASAEDCQRACFAHHDCYFFTYNTQNKKCVRKRQGADTDNSVAHETAIAGPHACY